MTDTTPEPGAAADAPVPAHGLGPAAAPVPPPLPRAARLGSIGAVWAVAVLLAVLIGVLSTPTAYASWLSLALAVCVLLAFVAQLATQRKDGFVDRLAVTLTGSFVILGITGAILGAVAASA